MGATPNALEIRPPCFVCGYDLRASPVACPECGLAVATSDARWQAAADSGPSHVIGAAVWLLLPTVSLIVLQLVTVFTLTYSLRLTPSDDQMFWDFWQTASVVLVLALGVAPVSAALLLTRSSCRRGTKVLVGLGVIGMLSLCLLTFADLEWFVRPLGLFLRPMQGLLTFILMSAAVGYAITFSFDVRRRVRLWPNAGGLPTIWSIVFLLLLAGAIGMTGLAAVRVLETLGFDALSLLDATTLREAYLRNMLFSLAGAAVAGLITVPFALTTTCTRAKRIACQLKEFGVTPA